MAGERVAFVAVVGQARTLVAMTADGKSPLVAAPVSQAKVVGISWVGEDHILVKIYHTVPLGMDFEVAKAEFATVVAINLKTRGRRQDARRVQGLSGPVGQSDQP